MAKFILGGIVSSIVMALFVAGVARPWAALPPQPAWTVNSSIGTHHMLIIHVDADPDADLGDIGESLVAPAIGKFDEVLIYVRSGRSTVRRIQWTPQQGFRQLLITP